MLCSRVLLLVRIIFWLVMLLVNLGGIFLRVILMVLMIWFIGLVKVFSILLLEIVKLCGMFFDLLMLEIIILMI